MVVGSLLFVRAPCARVIPLVVTVFLSAIPLVPTRTHYFVRYLTVMVKVRTLENIFPVSLAGSLV